MKTTEKQLAEQILACRDNPSEMKTLSGQYPSEVWNKAFGQAQTMLNESEKQIDRFTPSQEEAAQGVVTKDAVTCGVCGSLAARYSNRFQCQKNPNHVGDLVFGIFSDLTPPKATGGAQ